MQSFRKVHKNQKPERIDKLKTLIIEFQTSGHYPEYLKHFLNKINETNTQDNFIIYLTPSLKPHLKEFEATNVYKSIIYFDESLAQLYNSFANTRQMANLFYTRIIEIKKRTAFNHVMFLNLSLVIRSNQILSPLKKLSFSFSGILMNSPYRIREKKTNIFLQYKRELPLRFLIWNKNCSKIFLLNDKKGVNFYKKWSSKIHFINDPVRLNPPSDLNVYNYHGINPKAISFLQIGKLGAYKGTLDIIDAFSDLESDYSKKAHLLLVGKVNRDTNLENDKVKKLKNEKALSIRDEFVADDDFSAYMEQSHVVLIANKNIENSSGIVNHCLANNKVVIAPDKGFYKEAFKNYKAIVNYNESFSLKDAMVFALDNFDGLSDEAQKFDNKSFIEENSVDTFSETLLNHLT